MRILLRFAHILFTLTMLTGSAWTVWYGATQHVVPFEYEVTVTIEEPDDEKMLAMMMDGSMPGMGDPMMGGMPGDPFAMNPGGPDPFMDPGFDPNDPGAMPAEPGPAIAAEFGGNPYDTGPEFVDPDPAYAAEVPPAFEIPMKTTTYTEIVKETLTESKAVFEVTIGGLALVDNRIIRTYNPAEGIPDVCPT